jgi:hypothetical protein
MASHCVTSNKTKHNVLSAGMQEGTYTLVARANKIAWQYNLAKLRKVLPLWYSKLDKVSVYLRVTLYIACSLDHRNHVRARNLYILHHEEGTRGMGVRPAANTDG